MFIPNSRKALNEAFQNRRTQAVAARPTPSAPRETQEMPRPQQNVTPHAQAPTNPEDWTRECLFDCYND